jgi:hypothetical protein
MIDRAFPKVFEPRLDLTEKSSNNCTPLALSKA